MVTLASLRNRARETVDLERQTRLEEFKKDRDHHRRLRDGVKCQVFYTLWAELLFFGGIVLLQGFRPWGFALNDWVFGIMVNGVLVQTIFLVRYIIKSLFPAGLPQ